jgi:hypothetical protein
MNDEQPGYYNVPYDLFSIMHYGKGNGVLKSIDPNRNYLMGQRVGLSFLDIQLANNAYQCSIKCPRIDCKNEGFLNHKCECFCPDGVEGKLCEKVNQKSKSNNLFK